jgi:hypothetical protein
MDSPTLTPRVLVIGLDAAARWRLPVGPGGKRRDSIAGYIRDMVDRPDRVCVPIEMEMLPLYREPRASARLRREQKREQRREKRESPTRSERVLARLAAGANAVTRRLHA